MKKLLVAILLVSTTATAAYPALKLIGKGDAVRLDTSSFSPEVMANYETFRVKCQKCHSLERIVVAIRTGVGPISGQPIDRKAANACGAKLVNQPEARMARTDATACAAFVNYLFVQSER